MKDPIAIIGAACRFPGNVSSLSSFWNMLESETDAISNVPPDRFSLERFISNSSGLQGHSYVSAAGIINDVKYFDPSFFGISRKEALFIDPQQRLILETSYEAMEHAGLKASELRGSNTGVYMGASNVDMSLLMSHDPAFIAAYTMTGSTLSIVSNRVSYVFDFHGPSITLDTACSSSMVAVHQACEALRSGIIPLAVAGGVNVLMSPYPFIGFSAAQMLSPDGRCKVFDASGNGYVRSEGAGVIILKSLSKALKDKDRILALIAGSGVNSDGRTTGISMPNEKSQSDLLKQIYKNFKLDKKKIVYVEAHGTGTAVGDPIEASAIGKVLAKSLKGTRIIPVGSVKTNIGHLESASGMAGLIKAILVLQKNKIPANLHFKTPNPLIDFSGLNITVPCSLTELPSVGGAELISVNSFGFGGTNAHVVLQRADCENKKTQAGKKFLAPVFISAKSSDSVAKTADALAELLDGKTEDESYDIAATQAHSREQMPFRAVAAGRTRAELCSQLRKIAGGSSKSNTALISESIAQTNVGGVFVFSGNGSQWLGMGKTLFSENEIFRETIENVDRLLAPLQDWSLLEAIVKPEHHEDSIDLTEKSQPLLFAVQVGVVEALRKKGLRPSAVAGHSVGEVAAAWAAGALSLEDAARVIHYRSLSQASSRNMGGMAVIGLSVKAAQELLASYNGEVDIAAINTSSSLTIAGENKALKNFVELCKRQRIPVRMLQIVYPFHTRLMDGIKDELLENLAGINPKAPLIPFYSAVVGHQLTTPLDPLYWWHNIRKPVLFSAAVHSALGDGFRHFLEIGPNPILRSYLRDILRSEKTKTFFGPTMSQARADQAEIETVWKNAWQNGWELNFADIFPLAHAPQDLPVYSWHKEFVWQEETPENRGFLLESRKHPLLGWQLPGKASAFENTICLADAPWLADHKAGNSNPYPAAAFLESMLAAAAEIFPGEQQELERIAILRPLALSNEQPKVLHLNVDKEDGGFCLEARSHMSQEPMSLLAKGRIVSVAETPPLPELNFGSPENFGVNVEKASLYKAARRFLLHYGPAFQTVEQAWVKTDPRHPEVLAELGEAEQLSAAGMLIPPTLVDGAFQTLFLLLGSQGKEHFKAYLPAAFEKVILYEKGTPRFAYARLETISARSVVASFRLLDNNGRTLLYLNNCRFRRAAWLEHETAKSEAYRLALKALPYEDSKSESLTLDMDKLADEGSRLLQNNSLDESSPKVLHPHLLLQLAALAAAHETILSLCSLAKNDLRLNCEDLIKSGILAPCRESWICHLLERLESAELAVQNDGQWQIEPQGKRPAARTLWRTLLSTAPDYVTEASLLAHVFSLRKEILSGKYDDCEDMILPSRLKDSYFCNASALSSFTKVQEMIVRSALKDAGPTKQINILLCAKNTTCLVPQVLSLLSEKPCRMVVAEKTPDSAKSSAQLFENKPELVFQSVDFEEPAPEHRQKYQLIILSSFLFEAADSSLLLSNCRAMLAPGGLILLQEPSPTMFADYVFGAQSSWWRASQARNLPVSLMQTRAYWQKQLEAAGFTKTADVGQDFDKLRPASLMLASRGEIPEQSANPVVMQAAVTDENKQAEVNCRSWLLVSGPEQSQSAELAALLHSALSEAGQKVSCLSAAAETEKNAFNPEIKANWQNIFAAVKNNELLNVIYLAGYDTRDDLSAHELSALQNASLNGLSALAQAFDALRSKVKLWVISGGAITGDLSTACPVPSQGVLAGFTRVLGNEMRLLEPRLLDIHGDAKMLFADPVRKSRLVAEMLTPQNNCEIVLSEGLRYTPRLVYSDSLCPKKASDNVSSGAVLTFDNPGRLQNLYWKKTDIAEPATDEVQIEVKCTGLNFRDVMWAMGLLLDEALENGFSGPGMGIECSGVVSAVGSNVHDFKVGDEVVCFAPTCFKTHVITKASAVAHKPKALSFAAAATIPVSFITAWYSIKHLANMQAGEKLLVHGAAGGVGLAAIQIAAHLGVEVFATAGSPEKHHFLRQLGVRNLYSSRSLSFAAQIMDATEGKGVDAVLNSLAGEAISAGISVLKPFGRFLELGKRDFYADSPMRLRPFSNNLSYFGVDVDQLLVFQPALGQRLFTELISMFADRKLIPLPHAVYPVGKTVEAFQAMQQSAHIGKIVVSMSGAQEIAVAPAKNWRKITLKTDASYLVTGGTGGLGLASAARLARRGAKNLILVSRNGVSDPASQKIVDEMRLHGINVQVVKADAGNSSKLKATLKPVLQSLPPLRGIIHAAAVLDDKMVSNLTPESIQKVLAAKSIGAYNLHLATLDLPLDFFVLYSSATTPFGNPGQSAYVAANCMLETLAAWRRKNKLPGEVIGWGPIDDTGMVTRNPKARQMLLKILGVSPTKSRDALYWLENCIAEDIGESHYFGLDWQNRADLPALAAPMFSYLRSQTISAKTVTGTSLEDLHACSPEQGIELISTMLLDEIAHVLRMQAAKVAKDVSLVSQGMDSLMAVELSLAIEQKFELTGYSLPLSEKTTAVTLAESLFTAITGSAGDATKTGDEASQYFDSIKQKHGVSLSEDKRNEILTSLSGGKHERQ